MLELPGTYNILFVGRTDWVKAEITREVIDAYGHPIYLVGPKDDVLYNWSTITIMRKAR